MELFPSAILRVNRDNKQCSTVFGLISIFIVLINAFNSKVRTVVGERTSRGLCSAKAFSCC